MINFLKYSSLLSFEEEHGPNGLDYDFGIYNQASVFDIVQIEF